MYHLLSVISPDPQSEADIRLWKETWDELVPSTEAGIRLHLSELVAAVCPALESQSWAIKAQGASAIATVTEKMSEEPFCVGCILHNYDTSLISRGLRGGKLGLSKMCLGGGHV